MAAPQLEAQFKELQGLKQATLDAIRAKGDKLSGEDFEFETTFGRGRFGRVRTAKFKGIKGKQYPICIKVLHKTDVIKLEQVEHIKNEKETLFSVNHLMAIQLFGTFQDKDNVYMVLEFINGGELFVLLRESKRFNDKKAKFYAMEVISLVMHLHSIMMVFRDVKPENILLNSQGHVKFCDFGFAKFLRADADKTYTACGTPPYMAPEIIRNKGYGLPVDWWATGVLIFEMLCGMPPFAGENQPAIFKQVLTCHIVYPPNMSSEAKDLVKRFLNPDDTKRLGNTHEEGLPIVTHKWFKDMDWDQAGTGCFEPPWLPENMDPFDTSRFPAIESSVKDDDPPKVEQSLFEEWHVGVNVAERQIEEAAKRNKMRQEAHAAKQAAIEAERIRLIEKDAEDRRKEEEEKERAAKEEEEKAEAKRREIEEQNKPKGCCTVS